MKNKTTFLIAAIAVLFMASCKKESRCYTCGIDQYSPIYNMWASTGRLEDFCGTEKELKAYQAYKLKQNIRLNCR